MSLPLDRSVRGLGLSAVLGVLASGVAQAGDPPPAAHPKEKAAAPASEAPTAAPPREFEKYAFVILRSGPKAAAPQTPEAEKKLLAQHLGHLRKMAELGKLVVAGPFGDQPDPSMRGLCLYKTSLEEARQLAEQDPAVKAGHLKVEVMTWYTEKGALAFPIADKLAAPAQGK